MRHGLRTLLVSGALLLPGCAHAPPDTAADAATDDSCANAACTDADAPDDPAEATNRRIFRVNMAVDRNVAKPVATAYRDDLPGAVRRGVHNFVTNLEEPKVLVNDILQGNLYRASATTGRFVLNSTIGAAGLFDVADSLGLPHHEADFGQTLGVWGIAPGPSVQLPLLGPSNVRDSAGTVVGFFADPLAYIPGGAITVITATGTGGKVVDGRAEVLEASNDLEKHALDYYAALRSVTAQRRAALVEEGRAGLVRPETKEGARQ